MSVINPAIYVVDCNDKDTLVLIPVITPVQSGEEQFEYIRTQAMLEGNRIVQQRKDDAHRSSIELADKFKKQRS